MRVFLLSPFPHPTCIKDDDEITNQRGGSIRRREQSERQEGGGRGGGREESERQGGDFSAPSSRWNIDGSEIGHSDIEVRY